MRLDKIPSNETRQLHYMVEHDHGTSQLVLEFWLGRPAGFCHRFEAWPIEAGKSKKDMVESDEFIAQLGADIRQQVLMRLPELLSTRPPSNHALIQMSSTLDEIEAFERSLQPEDHPFATTGAKGP
mgnify:CR=1 FL=1